MEPPGRVSEEQSWLPPYLFDHKDLAEAPGQSKTLDREALTNMINHIHFMGGYVLVHLHHFKYGKSVLLRAYPEPCIGQSLRCRWSNERFSGIQMKHYRFLHLLIDDGQSMVLVPASVQEMNNEILEIQLPENSYSVSRRRCRRYPSSGISAELLQGAFVALGELLDFNPFGFRIRIKSNSSRSFHWFNSDETATVHLREEGKIFFSGVCRCLRKQGKPHEREIILAPTAQKVTRFDKNKTRNPRLKLVPSPTVLFEHPLLKKKFQLEVFDISTAGLSVFEESDKGVLVPGMVIPRLCIDFAGVLKIQCEAQVIYRSEESRNAVRFGIGFLDMDLEAYSRLTGILANALDPHAHVSNEVNIDALWEFFFDSGFIYPKKYGLIHSYRENFKETYTRLYQESSEIAKHFTYQQNGCIYGHISMVRAFERTWLIHHHAARAMNGKRPGFILLKQIMHYLNDMHRYPSAKIDYVMSYFRPENKFPNYVFGGFTRSLEDMRGCSMDLFAYLPFKSEFSASQLPDGWILRECSASDLWELNQSYEHRSGGLLLEAMDLDQDGTSEDLEGLYRRLGLTRKRKAYALSFGSELHAVLVMNQSDLGLNLAELLNGITVFVIDPETLPWEVLSTALAQLTPSYSVEKVPLLLHPFEYVQLQKIPYEKRYHGWVLNVRYGSEFMEYMRKKFRLGYA